jgi:hypothetical protein
MHSTITPQIVRANMDGSQVTTIISGTDVVTPTALAIDAASKRQIAQVAYFNIVEYVFVFNSYC